MGNVLTSRNQGHRGSKGDCPISCSFFFGLPWGLAHRTTQHCRKRCKKGGVPQKWSQSDPEHAPASARISAPCTTSQCNSKGSTGCGLQLATRRRQSLPTSRSGRLISFNTFESPACVKCAQESSMMFIHVHDACVNIVELCRVGHFANKLTPRLWPGTSHRAPAKLASYIIFQYLMLMKLTVYIYVYNVSISPHISQGRSLRRKSKDPRA